MRDDERGGSGSGGDDEPSVHEIAARGIRGSASPLPHFDRIQASFGLSHDLSRVQAHIGGEAVHATRALGAAAYAVGNHVAFRSAPDLRLAAHEAAHVVQQRAGVSLAGGMTEPGDRYERHADAVADRVSSGSSAADLLDAEGAGGAGTAVVARAGAGGDGGDGGEDAPQERGEDEAPEEDGVLPGAALTADPEAPSTATVMLAGGTGTIDLLRAAADDDNEAECLALIKKLDPAEKATVRLDQNLMKRLARDLDAAQMFEATIDLGCALPWKVYWVDRAGNVKNVDWVPTIEIADETDRDKLRTDEGMMGILAKALSAKRMLAVTNALRISLPWKVYWVDRAGSVKDVDWFAVLAGENAEEIKRLAQFERGMKLLRPILFDNPEAWRQAVAAHPALRGLFSPPQQDALTQLRSAADKTNVDEELCLSLLHTLVDAEKDIVRVDKPLMRNLASAFDAGEMVTCVNAIGFSLVWKVYWLREAVSLTKVSAGAWTGMLASAPDSELRDLFAYQGGAPVRKTPDLLRALMARAPDTMIGLVQAPGGDTWKEALADADVHDLPLKPVNETKADRLDRVALLGDGTPAKPGMDVGEFEGYIARQADWFTALAKADRDLLWPIAILLQRGSHVGGALRKLKLADLGAMKAADQPAILAYAAGAAPDAKTVRITRPYDTLARVLQIGTGMAELATFVPAPVLSVVIEQPTLEKLVDEALIPELREYYTTFGPTLENPKEQWALLALLRSKVSTFKDLVGWVNDLHIFTADTRLTLVANVGERKKKERPRPVLLVLMSGLDWNAAFLQASNLEAAVKNAANLALIVQSRTIKDEITMVNMVADDFGQLVGGKGQIGQVVIAGHGSATTVEQTTTGKDARDNKTSVGYKQDRLNPQSPGDDSELLIDTLLQRMDPKHARIVFAGCLVGSHEIPTGTSLSDPKTAAAEIKTAIKNNPNLRDLVEARMVALGIAGNVEAANASTTFSAFNLDAAGKAQLSLTWDPDIGKSKSEYVKTGAEPEGALRAALETWADPKFGPAWTTTEMDKHVTAKSGDTGWWQSLTCAAYALVLDKKGSDGNVSPVVLNDLAHRVVSWLLAGWIDTANAGGLAGAVKTDEAEKVYKAMLGSDKKGQAFLPIIVEQAWMKADAKHAAAFMTALDGTGLTRSELAKLLAASLVDPLLPTLLKAADPAKPSRGQLLLALTIAVERPTSIPPDVVNLLTGAAGGAKTTTFPAALGVEALLDGASEIGVLRSIGLAPGVSVKAPPPTSTAAPPPGPVLDDANIDVTGNKMNETFLVTRAREVTLGGKDTVPVHERPAEWSKVVGSLSPGQRVRIAGTTEVTGPKGTRTWSAIDLNGKLVFALGVF